MGSWTAFWHRVDVQGLSPHPGSAFSPEDGWSVAVKSSLPGSKPVGKYFARIEAVTWQPQAKPHSSLRGSGGSACCPGAALRPPTRVTTLPWPCPTPPSPLPPSSSCSPSSRPSSATAGERGRLHLLVATATHAARRRSWFPRSSCSSAPFLLLSSSRARCPTTALSSPARLLPSCAVIDGARPEFDPRACQVPTQRGSYQFCMIDDILQVRGSSTSAAFGSYSALSCVCRLLLCCSSLVHNLTAECACACCLFAPGFREPQGR